ncbi:MAG: hypothetical protein ABJA32_04980 [Ginsengibacter sp.]|jgi:hypothetical protein
MDSKLDDFESEPEPRPTFLTVLCILTFIGSGWGIISAIWSYTTADEIVKVINVQRLDRNNDSLHVVDSARLERNKNSIGYMIGRKLRMATEKMMTVENIHKKSIGDLIAALFTLAGAILMWFQRRNGFYLYIAGVVFVIALPFYLYGIDLLTVGIASFGAFFGLLFIVLYALNLKWMSRSTEISA